MSSSLSFFNLTGLGTLGRYLNCTMLYSKLARFQYVGTLDQFSSILLLQPEDCISAELAEFISAVE